MQEQADRVRNDAAKLANTKIERYGRKVWGVQNLIGNPNKDCPGPYWSSVGKLSDIFKDSELAYEALLINIEPIGKCEHPKDKVKLCSPNPFMRITGQLDPGDNNNTFYCECGAKLRPSTFEEIK